jgi:metallophosphoesterase superfamily enzyme
VLRHAAVHAEPAGEISGHYHPKAITHVRGRRLSSRCFISDGQRLIMPAFGAYAGGLNVLDPAIRPLFRPDAFAWLLGSEKLHLLPLARLTADPQSRQRTRQYADQPTIRNT